MPSRAEILARRVDRPGKRTDRTGWPTEAEYAWAEGQDAFCLSLVEATSPEAVLTKMVGTCGTGIVSVGEARRWAWEQTEGDYGSVIQAGVVGGWVVTVEANGHTATLPQVVRRLSNGSRAIVVFRNVHSHTSFLYAVDGVVVRSFDPLLYDDPFPWDGRSLPEESGLEFGRDHPMASAFACAERLTGVRLPSDVLADHGDWLAVGHHPEHLLYASVWAADTSNAERLPCTCDPRRQSIPNCLFWGDEVEDAPDLFVLGWIGWVQFLLVAIATAAMIALRFGYLQHLPVSEGRLVLAAVVLVGLTSPIGRMLEGITSMIHRARKRWSRGRRRQPEAFPQ